MKHIADIPKSISMHSFDLIGSTNEKAKEMAAGGADDWTVIWSRAQNKGKGRQGKNWVSPVGSLYMSILLRPKYTVQNSAKVAFLAAIAVKDAIEGLIPHDAAITFKWPNDILINGKKAAGILLESSQKAGSDTVDWLIVGIGVNVKSFPEDVDFPATSLLAEGAKEDIGVEITLENIIKCFHSLQKAFDSKGFSSIRKKWLKNAEGLNRTIKVKSANKILAGTFLDIDEEGMLIMKTDDGEIKQISTGEVFFDGSGVSENATGY